MEQKKRWAGRYGFIVFGSVFIFCGDIREYFQFFCRQPGP